MQAVPEVGAPKLKVPEPKLFALPPLVVMPLPKLKVPEPKEFAPVSATYCTTLKAPPVVALPKLVVPEVETYPPIL